MLGSVFQQERPNRGMSGAALIKLVLLTGASTRNTEGREREYRDKITGKEREAEWFRVAGYIGKVGTAGRRIRQDQAGRGNPTPSMIRNAGDVAAASGFSGDKEAPTTLARGYRDVLLLGPSGAIDKGVIPERASRTASSPHPAGDGAARSHFRQAVNGKQGRHIAGRESMAGVSIPSSVPQTREIVPGTGRTSRHTTRDEANQPERRGGRGRNMKLTPPPSGTPPVAHFKSTRRPADQWAFLCRWALWMVWTPLGTRLDGTKEGKKTPAWGPWS
ncbi:hypothetical protein GGTG_12232 [Gaeumannomyces tritici R3-111a-1]|uniref:Uncharacterized protein n=1 Tax=Gaeumannomyces tritici (strain R3-111a-1) TaxID=644352 RepID=J3PFF7_GAET3|nr:hypothetical protein GGTG_12232 [Gaeumannomyces tritici R3-111a-1]EJT70059.1 hypothetical protein GGTG_12232 [Gaeumannomyces tritici R3-111a-1]